MNQPLPFDQQHLLRLVEVYDNTGRPKGRVSLATAAEFVGLDPALMAAALDTEGRVRTPEYQVLCAATLGGIG